MAWLSDYKRIVLAVALLLMVITVVGIRPRKADLLSMSTRLTADNTTYSMPVWSDDNSVLYAPTEVDRHPEVREVDIRTGKSKPAKAQVVGGARLYGRTLTSQEKLAVAETFDPYPDDYLISPFQDRGLVLIDPQYSMRWHYAAVFRGSRIHDWVTQNVNATCRNVSIAEGGPSVATTPWQYGASGKFIGVAAERIGLLVRETRSLEHKWDFDRSFSENWQALRVRDGQPEVEKHDVRSPDLEHPWDQENWDVALSPDGNRVAWLVCRLALPSRFEDWMASWMKWVKLDYKYVVELAVSRVDGTDWQTIGAMEYTQPMDSGDARIRCMYCPDLLAWSPDGKHLSFNYRGAIWVVNVN